MNKESKPKFQLENYLRHRGSRGSLVWRIWNLRIRLILFHGSKEGERLTGWAMLLSLLVLLRRRNCIFFTSEGIFCFGASETKKIGWDLLQICSTANDNLAIKCTIKTYYSRLCCTVGHSTKNYVIIFLKLLLKSL